MFYLRRFFIFIVLLLIIFPTPVLAYFDPGTGSQLFQLLLASLLGALFTIKMYWKKLKDFLKGFAMKKNEGEND